MSVIENIELRNLLKNVSKFRNDARWQDSPFPDDFTLPSTSQSDDPNIPNILKYAATIEINKWREIMSNTNSCINISSYVTLTDIAFHSFAGRWSNPNIYMPINEDDRKQFTGKCLNCSDPLNRIGNLCKRCYGIELTQRLTDAKKERMQNV